MDFIEETIEEIISEEEIIQEKDGRIQHDQFLQTLQG